MSVLSRLGVSCCDLLCNCYWTGTERTVELLPNLIGYRTASYVSMRSPESAVVEECEVNCPQVMFTFQRQEFSRNVWHCFKTPVSIIRYGDRPAGCNVANEAELLRLFTD